MARPFLMPLNERTASALKVPLLMTHECTIVDCANPPTYLLLISEGRLVDGRATVNVTLLCDDHARKAVAAGAKAPED